MSNHEKHEMEPSKGQFLVYQAEDGKLKLDVRFEDESVWLTQQLMADLFQTTKQNISLHIQNIYEECELVPEATVKKYLTVRSEGNRQVKRLLDYYNLDMIISVGYRIKSHVATRFRIWATQQLTEFVKKGFVLDDERLKNPDLPLITLRNWNGGFRISAPQSVGSIRKLPIFMPPVSTMTQHWISVLSSSRPCRIKCTGR